MNRSTPIAVVILGLSLTASAQKPAGEAVSVRGCVERAQRDGSLSANATGTHRHAEHRTERSQQR